MSGQHFLSSFETSRCEKHCTLSTLSLRLWVVLGLLFWTLCLTNRFVWTCVDNISYQVLRQAVVRNTALFRVFIRECGRPRVVVSDTVLNKPYLLRRWFVVWTCVGNILYQVLRQAVVRNTALFRLFLGDFGRFLNSSYQQPCDHTNKP